MFFVGKDFPGIYDFIFFKVNKEKVQLLNSFLVILIYYRYSLTKFEDQLCVVVLSLLLLFCLVETSLKVNKMLKLGGFIREGIGVLLSRVLLLQLIRRRCVRFCTINAISKCSELDFMFGGLF